MPIDTNLSRSPYFDDYSDTSQYYRILYKPGFAVQTRELNQTQSILFDQIDKFGRSVYKKGSVIEGCTFTFDKGIAYVKINDNYANDSSFTISDFENQYAYNQNGLRALIVNSIQGLTSQAPNTNTLYVKYLNSALYANGTQQNSFDPNEIITISTSANISIGNVTVCSNTLNANIGNPTGTGYIMYTTEGTIFHKGAFLYVKPQSIVITRYSDSPDGLSVGFNADETVITASSDSSLYDNAAGSPNYTAPGADRLKITPTFVVRSTEDAETDKQFFSVATFKNGGAVTVNQTAQYSMLGAEMARRTYETNGDFVVNPFVLTASLIANTSDPLYANNLNLITSKGLAYVNGYRVEYLNNSVTNLRRGTDYSDATNQITSANFGNFLYVEEFCGEFGDSNQIIEVELHNVYKTPISSQVFLSAGYSSTTKIGTAFVRGFSFDSGTPGLPETKYRLYLFNVQMVGGNNFEDIKSVIYRSGGNNLGIADIVPTLRSVQIADGSYTTSNVAQLEQTYNNMLIYPLKQTAIKPDGFSDTSFIYRQKSTSQILTTGNAAITILSPSGTGVESFGYSGTLSGTTEQDFYIVPQTDGRTTTKPGTVTVSTSSNIDGTSNVDGSSTTFLTNYKVGDYIWVNLGTPEQKLIIDVANNTQLTVVEPFGGSSSGLSHAVGFPANVPIPISNRNERTIEITSPTTATLTLNDSIQSAFNIDLFYSVQRANTVPIAKTKNTDVFVKIDCSTHPNKFNGPWSLGIPDVLDVTGVWVGSGSYPTDDDLWYNNLVNKFSFDNGQRDTHYDLASLYLKGGTTILDSQSKLIVRLNCFTRDESQGRGFFTANSYPIDDANTANTLAISTSQIPVYVSSSGTAFDLRDSVDFRPVATNTAVITSVTSSTTVNPSSTLTIGSIPYLPAPDSVFQTNLEYYLKRTDLAILNIDGKFSVVEGKPNASNPIPPLAPAKTMVLGVINVPPYPSLPPNDSGARFGNNYTISITPTQQKRYTMKDIGSIEDRLDNLEYYTSLSLLEQSTSNLLVKSGLTGQNRFQNGFFVDNLDNFKSSDISNPGFNISLDVLKSQVRPSINTIKIDLLFDEARSVNVVKHGELYMLSHSNTQSYANSAPNKPYISQVYASNTRPCVYGKIYNYRGKVTIDPDTLLATDLGAQPIIHNVNEVTSIFSMVQEYKSNLQFLWGEWVNIYSSPKRKVGSTVLSRTVKKKADGSKRITTVTRVDYQTDDILLKTSQPFLFNVNYSLYLKSDIVNFRVTGLKPKTQHWVYFSDVDVTEWCAPCYTDRTLGSFTGNSKYNKKNYGTGKRGDKASDGNYISGVFGDPLISDSKGRIYGNFLVPPGTFAAGINTFDVASTDNIENITNQTESIASRIIFGDKITWQSGDILTVRAPEASPYESIDYNYIAGKTSITKRTVKKIPPPFKPPAPPPDPPVSNTTPKLALCDPKNPAKEKYPYLWADWCTKKDTVVYVTNATSNTVTTTETTSVITQTFNGGGGGGGGQDYPGAIDSSTNNFGSGNGGNGGGDSLGPRGPITDSGQNSGYTPVSSGSSFSGGFGTDPGNVSSTGGYFCLVPWAAVTMEDGSYKEIQYVNIGDKLRSMSGEVNTVMKIKNPAINTKLVSFNGLNAFITETHPLLTDRGWGTFNLELFKTTKSEEYDRIVIDNGGKELVQIDESVKLAKKTTNGIEYVNVTDIKFEEVTDFTVYTISVDGDNTYISEDFISHNKP